MRLVRVHVAYTIAQPILLHDACMPPLKQHEMRVYRGSHLRSAGKFTGVCGFPHTPGFVALLQDPLVPAVQEWTAILGPPLLVAQEQVGQDLR